MESAARVVRAQGPYDLPPELHYLRPPPAWWWGSAERGGPTPVSDTPARSSAESSGVCPSGEGPTDSAAPSAVIAPPGHPAACARAVGQPVDAAPSPGVVPSGGAARGPGDTVAAARAEPIRAIDAGQPPRRPKLLVRVRAAIQMRQYSGGRAELLGQATGPWTALDGPVPRTGLDGLSEAPTCHEASWRLGSSWPCWLGQGSGARAWAIWCEDRRTNGPWN